MTRSSKVAWHLPLFDRSVPPTPSPQRPARLVIMARSRTKRAGEDRVPAIERYDGPLWQTLRAADPGGMLAQVAFVSARYGFRAASTPIVNYDARMTRDLADAMISGGMGTRWPRPRLPSMPDNAGIYPGVEIAGLHQAAREPLRDVALVGGALYLEVMRALLAGFRAMGCLAPDAAITEINGPIGFMRRDLRLWLQAAPNPHITT